MTRRDKTKDWRELRTQHLPASPRRKSFTQMAYGENSASVYVVAKGDAEVKIGVSKNVGNRSIGLQTSNSSGLAVFWAVRLERADAYRLEAHIHQQLRKTLNHIRGEWYAMAPEAAVEIVKKAAKKLQLKTEADLLFGYGEVGNGTR